MSRKLNPVQYGRMYKVSDGGSIKGVRFQKSGKVDVLVVPSVKRNPRKKKRNKAKAKRTHHKAKPNAGPYSFRKTKKTLRKAGHGIKSSQRRKYVMRSGTASSRAARHLVDVYRAKNRHRRRNPSRPYDVYLNRRKIDTVFQDAVGSTKREREQGVKRSLVHHDGYDPGITVRERPKGR